MGKLLGSGRPTTKTQKEKSIDSVKEINLLDIKSEEKMKRFNVDIPEKLHTAMKVQAAKDNVSLNVLTKMLFNEYLSKVSKEGMSK